MGKLLRGEHRREKQKSRIFLRAGFRPPCDKTSRDNESAALMLDAWAGRYFWLTSARAELL
jgi:hypothetical protein